MRAPRAEQICDAGVSDVMGEFQRLGRIDFEAIYALLDELGYEGHISAEYRPMARSTEDSLGWLR